MSDEEFTPITEILTRKNLDVIYNFWHGKYNLLKTKKNKKGEMKLIYEYLEELKSRDKQLISEKRARAAKQRAEDKRRAQEEAIRRREEEEELAMQKKVTFDAEFPEFNEKLLDINNEITRLEIQIAKLKKQKTDLLSKFQNKCEHRFGNEYSIAGDRWVKCEICGYYKATHECCF